MSTTAELLRNGWFVTQKPPLNEMRRYANTRRLVVDQDFSRGLQRSFDLLGNTVFTSRGYQEKTFEGFTPSTISIAPAGRELLHLNPGLLRKIDSGKVEAEKLAEQGNEGFVYRLPLITKGGPRDYALKYTFPSRINNARYSFDAYTPGIIQQTILQAAQREQPVPDIKYAVPLIASLNMTLTPFVENSINAATLISSLNSNTAIDAKVSDLNVPLVQELANSAIDVKKAFAREMKLVLLKNSEDLEAWAITKVSASERLRANHIKVDGNPLILNTVIELDTIAELFPSYRYLSTFNSSNPEFVHQLLSGCHVVELLVGGDNATPK